MSAETKTALEKALQDHLTDTTGTGGVLTDYVLHAAYVDLSRPQSDNVTGYFLETRGARHASMGLSVMLSDWLAEDDGDDD